jgi:hypothetical protein
MNKLMLCVAAFALSLSISAFAANVASDDQSQSAYDDGWQSTDNGGTGFGAWTLATTSGNGGENGHFVGSSTGNADGSDNGVNNGVASDGDIDTGGTPEAWALYANSGQTASGTRPLTGGSLAVNQTVTVEFDNGFVDGGATVGIGLQNSSGENVWEMFFVGGQAVYQYNQLGGVTNTAVGYGDEGLSVEFTLTGASTYSATLTRYDGTSDTIAGSLLTPAGGSSIDQFRVFNFNSGSGGANNFYVNSLTVIPEPSSIALACLGAIGAVVARRRRHATNG